MTTEVDPGEQIDTGDIGGALRTIDGRLKGIRQAMDRKFARNLIVIIGVGIAVAVALAVAVSARNALADYKASTQIARIASCNQYNDQAGREIDAQQSSFHALVAALVKGANPQVQKDAEKFNAEQDKLIAQKHPLRDCSPQGIADYLSGKPNKETP